MATNLLDFDQVVALTEQTINTQFELMFMMGVIEKNISLKLAPSSDFGIFGTIRAPTVSIALYNTVNPTQVAFNIPFDTGTAKYSSPLGQTEELDISGWTIALDVNLAKLTLTSDYKGVKVSHAAKNTADTFLGQSMYTVSAILLDFDNNLNYDSAEVFDKAGNPANNTTILTMLNSLINHMIKDGNPYLLSINPTLSEASDPGLDVFKPTGVMYNTHLYNNVNSISNFNTYNMLVMNQGHKLPWTETTLPKFTQNLASDNSQIDGRLYISKDQFISGYIEPEILPVLAKAMGGEAKFTGGDGSWSYKYILNTEVGAIYTEYRNTCSLKIDPDPSGSDKVLLSGDGAFWVQQKSYETTLKNIHNWTATAEQKFLYVMTLEAGKEGKITINFAETKEDPTRSTWVSEAEKILGFSVPQGLLDALVAGLKQMEVKVVDKFTEKSEHAFKVLQASVILPAGKTYFFKNMTLTSEQDVQLDIKIND
ncbi:MAG: hypothetical protein V2J55_18360 [Candidatus Competibacteraceae bacterium]|jgi:hypothetical protein|nr:hypothetical protein [Candidatus Competibacteraceae bacterium]